jgi:hypothetical protein
MADRPENLTTLEARINKIEKQNKRLKKTLALLTIAILAIGAMGAAMAPADGHFKQITANAITLLDEGGNKLLEMGSGELGTGMRIYNKAGKRLIGIGIAADEGGSGILFADSTGAPRIGIGMDAKVPSLAIVGANGKKILALGGDEKGYGFIVMDENEVERAGLGYKAGNTGIALYDANGQYLRGMIQQKDGIHYSSYVDENGKEIIGR